MRSVTDARNAFNTLIADAADGLTTHIVKGSSVVAHLIPASAPVLDDRNLQTALFTSLATSEAAAAAANEWRDGQLWHAGDPIGRMLAWAWRNDSHLCMHAFATFHGELQQAVGATIGLGAIWPGIRAALGVALDKGETAALFRYLDQNYDEYYHGPHRDDAQTP